MEWLWFSILKVNTQHHTTTWLERNFYECSLQYCTCSVACSSCIKLSTGDPCWSACIRAHTQIYAMIHVVLLSICSVFELAFSTCIVFIICLHIWFSGGADLWTFLLEFIVFDFCQSSQSYQKVIHCVVSPLSQICVCAILNMCMCTRKFSTNMCISLPTCTMCTMYMYSEHVPVCTCMFSILNVKKSLLQMCNKAIYDRYRLQD